jgi:hypothetical protein
LHLTGSDCCNAATLGSCWGDHPASNYNSERSQAKQKKAKQREEHGKSRGREGELGAMYVVHCCRDLLLLLWSSSSCCWLLCNGARCGSASSSSSSTTTDVFTSSYYTGLFLHHTNRGLYLAIVVVVVVVVFVVSVDVAAADNDADNDVDDDAAIVWWCFKSFSAVAGGFVNDFDFDFFFGLFFSGFGFVTRSVFLCCCGYFVFCTFVVVRDRLVRIFEEWYWFFFFPHFWYPE